MAIHDGPVPELEHQDRPQPVQVRAASGPLVPPEVGGQEIAVEVAVAEGVGAEQALTELALQAAPEPLLERDPEALLPPREHLGGQERFDGALEDVLRGAVSELQARGDAGDELDQPM